MKIVYIMYRVNVKIIFGILGNKVFMLDFCFVWKFFFNSLVVIGYQMIVYQIMVYYIKYVIVF